MLLTQTVQSGDWKNEKHVPELEYKELGEGKYEVSAFVGKEIAHPNTLEHHIVWIKVFFVPEGGKLPVEVANYNFSAHGESEIYTTPKAVSEFKSDKKGTLFALSYCNIHGLWENSLEIK
ncbi:MULTISPECIES: desulfoferrodoxin family protein [Anaerococcus]|uniref:desulfoferrodoxin family protein n=1 Tax=Anaerococcus TaxID=165779 RepID=UPI0008A5C663|nr:MULTISPECIES: desulfoferrodoxin family protein [Anaerococcus]MBS6920618.1 superoxide reductase [Anaerococcus vaginalis]MDU5560675.1 desulfoferrodoxin family protein [Anaerococcus vaginalis]MDU5988883.1 desulfoferrodoxin family protein [Anaerococcus vaginalis]OFO42749.1 superoxide reductase [Anaerococcus sp. HMSC075B03]